MQRQAKQQALQLTKVLRSTICSHRSQILPHAQETKQKNQLKNQSSLKNGHSTKQRNIFSKNIIHSAKTWVLLQSMRSTTTGLMRKFTQEKLVVRTIRILLLVIRVEFFLTSLVRSTTLSRSHTSLVMPITSAA